MAATILFATPEKREVAATPEKVILPSEKCGICYQLFEVRPGDTACRNCERHHCPKHTDRITVSELTPELCTECGEAYRLNGRDGLKGVKVRLLHTHGS